MPRLDRTGPSGEGPLTGVGRGYCRSAARAGGGVGRGLRRLGLAGLGLASGFRSNPPRREEERSALAAAVDEIHRKLDELERKIEEISQEERNAE